MGRLYLALLHYPVKNKDGDTIASAITNLDLHDIARAARTYGVTKFFVVTPLFDQQQLAQKIVEHWQQRIGASYNPDRREALDLIRIKESVFDVLEDIRVMGDKPARLVATSAAATDSKCLSFSDFRQMLENGDDQSYLLALGTAWGLTEAFVEHADYLLAPIPGTTGYNHLSVRSAASIMLDRLCGSD